MQHPQHGDAHLRFMQWAKWLLRNFRLNPGTIYSKPAPFNVSELLELKALGLNCFNAFGAPASLPDAKALADGMQSYVAELDAHNLTASMAATVYGFDESDALDTMQQVLILLERLLSFLDKG